MKLALITGSIMLSLCCLGQLNEDFSDGDFISRPTWTGSTNSFLVNDSGRLQLDEVDNGLAYLSTICHTIGEASWEFDVEMRFNPSARNFCRIYLTSDSQDLSGELNGYYLRIGGSEDDVSLFRQDLSEHVRIIDGIDEFVDTAQVQIAVRVTRDTFGRWNLFAKHSDVEQFQLLGHVQDERHFRVNYFGVLCQFTSTRSKGFFFDNLRVQGESFNDTEPPEVLSIHVLDHHRLKVTMSEPVQPPSFSQFNIAKIGSPIELFRSGYNTWEMTFPTSFTNGASYNLEVNNLIDPSDNGASFSLSFTFWEATLAAVHDLIISEIMADPSPVVQLPEKEYIEIYNRSKKVVDLSGWTISDANRQVVLTRFLMAPASYLILCPKEAEDLLPDSLSLMGLGSWPTLNNSGDLIILADSTGKAIHFVNYDDSWYRNNLKNLGGWSLEMIDTKYPCTGAHNWTASNAALGGTPGTQNSIATDNPDLIPPVIIDTFAPDNRSVQITFDQSLSIGQSSQAELVIEPSIQVDTMFIESFIEPKLTVQLHDTLSRGVIYQVTAKGFTDCNDNTGLDEGAIAPLGLAESPDSADVVINEILFNPRPLGVRFVELYNRSSKSLNLANWRFARWQDNVLTDFTHLSNNNLMIYPGEYKVFTENTEKLKDHYPKYADQLFYQVEDLPTLDNKQGSIVISDPIGAIIDQLFYHENMHHPLLIDRNGVSLERASPDEPGSDLNNWYSAAENSWYATPGKKNSQSFTKALFPDLTVSPKIISPLSGRFPSYTRISYQLNQPGNSGSVTIFNSRGRLVKTLINNALIPMNGFFQWDGTDDNLRPVSFGHYIVLFQVAEPHGKAISSRQTVVVAPDF